MGKLDDGRYIVADVRRACESAIHVRRLLRNVAVMDRSAFGIVRICLPQDPGQAGKDQAASLIKMLSGFPVTAIRPTGDKVTRAEPFSAQWQAGNVLVLAGAWNDRYFDELEGFPEAEHDDMVDGSSDAFTALQQVSNWGGLTT